MKQPVKLGNIIVISAPSGAGKSTIRSAILSEGRENVVYSVSYTTRQPRSGEENGRSYFFVREKVFKKMIKENKFAEWAKVHENYYGTSKEFLKKELRAGKNIILEIDVQGGINIKKRYRNRACMIFIMTPDFETLRRRLIARNKDCKEAIEIRIKNARKELKYLPKYEYLVINKKLLDAVDSVKTIMKSLKYKIQKI